MKRFELIYSVLSGIATDEEKDVFKAMLQNENDKKLYAEVEKLWIESSEIKNYQKTNVIKSFYLLGQKIKARKEQKRKIVLSAISGIAASLLIVFGVYWMNILIYDSDRLVKVNAPKGGHSQVTLPDGSTIWLNSDTYIEYNTDFGKDNRKIFLVGEAYFDVSKMSTPFIVNANNLLDVQVHGTRFNVMAYPEQEIIETTLEEGKVSLKSKEQDSIERLLKPGQWMRYNGQKHSYVLKEVNTDTYCDWVDGKLILREEPLAQLMLRLEKVYDVDIFIDKSLEIEDFHFNGVFENVPIEKIVEAIASAAGLDYEIDPNGITLKKNN